MNPSKNHPDAEIDLWRQYIARDQEKPDTSEIDPGLLAVYLDGKATPDQIEQIEASLAHNPDLIEKLSELRELQNLKPSPISQTLLARIKNLVPSSAGQIAPAVSGRDRWWLRLRYAAAAAAILLVAVLGYQLGDATFQGQEQIQASKASQTSRDLDELLFDPALALILQPNGRNGAE